MKISEIKKLFGNKLIGSTRMKRFVCLVLAYMSPEIIKYVTSSCWFMSSFEDAYAFTFTGSDLKNKHLVFLSDELLAQNEEQIKYTIAHEIGHVILGHRNSVFRKQLKIEIKKQEKEAHDFALKYTGNPL